MSRYVVVANRTLGREELSAHLGSILVHDHEAVIRAVVPIATPSFAAFEVGGAMGGIAVVDVETQLAGVRAAEERLDELLRWFAAIGVSATGETVAGDPVPAVERIVSEGNVAEVIVSTLPSRFSRWLRVDLPQRLRRRIEVPVIVIESDDEGWVDADSPTDESIREASDDSATRRAPMGESVYKIIELVGTSTESWERAAAAAILTAQQSLRDLRIAEVIQLDLVVGDGEVTVYRAKVKVSFKYQTGNGD